MISIVTLIESVLPFYTEMCTVYELILMMYIVRVLVYIPLYQSYFMNNLYKKP